MLSISVLTLSVLDLLSSVIYILPYFRLIFIINSQIVDTILVISLPGPPVPTEEDSPP
jgi:hypothetical protein